MGELYQKKNDNGTAASYFTKVAEAYSSDGFFLKAVALYKQVLKLDPALVEVNLRLAELHHQLQLLSEATSYYQVVANHYDKSGNARASLDTLKKIIELDPENVSSRIKLAEMYARGNMKAEARQEFERAAEYLKRHSRLEDYHRVLERLSAVDPENLVQARELAESYLAQGDQKRALAKLQVCFKADPSDPKTLILLATAFQGLGQIPKTVSVYKELARIYAAQGRTHEADQLWAKIAQLDPEDVDLLQRGGGRAAPPPPPPPLHKAAGAAPKRPGTESGKPNREQLSKLLTETDVYVKYGLHDKALEHLGRIFAVDAENLDAHEKAYHVYVASSNKAQAADQLLNVLRLCTRVKAVDRAQPYLKIILRQNPRHPEVATFVSVLGKGEAAESEFEAVHDDAILLDSSREEMEPSSFPEPASFDDLALEGADALASDEEVISLDGQDALPSEETQFTDEPLSSGSDPVLEMSADAILPADDEPQERPSEWEQGGEESDSAAHGPAYELELEDGDPVEAAPQLEADDGSSSEECDEAKFFLDHGLTDEAREILETVIRAHPRHRAASALLAQVKEVEASRRQPSAAAAKPLSAPAGVEATDAFDLAAELAQELGELGSEETSEAPEAGDDFQYSVDEVFAEFKKGLEKVVKPEDVDTHYDLGIAYKEMGLTDDAIKEFAIAREGCVGKKKEIDCWTMIAMLQKAKGSASAAVDSYKRALTSEHAVGEMERDLQFELAAAWEAAGKAGKALYHYSRVAKLDPSYRDVSSIVANLAQRAKPEPDPLPSKKSSSGVNGVNGVHDKGPASGLESSGRAGKSPADPPSPRRKGKTGFL
jgi:tetratricopeptide (TPR) repeat protein